MNYSERVLIVSRDGTAIYGRVIDNAGKLGRFEVISDYWGNDGQVYHQYSEAERKWETLAARPQKN